MHPTVFERNRHLGPNRCARCGGEVLRVILAPDREVRATNGWHWLSPLCGQCATPDEVAYASAVKDCPGCGMPMHHSPRDAMLTRWAACSNRCYQRAWRASRRQVKQPAKVVCEACKTGFQPRRVDARYCSNACRQWQHRLRQASRRLPASEPVLAIEGPPTE